MPRRKKTATVSDTPEAVARNEQARPAEPAPPILQPSVAEGFEEPTAPGDAAEPDATGTAPAEQHPAAGPVPHMVWARIEGGRDRPVGIKVETEAGRRPGIAHPRTLIRFRDDLLPTPDEKQRLKDARFKFCPDVGAWGQQKSAASLELAKRLATELARGRGDDGVGLYVQVRFDLGSVHPGWLERPRFEGIPLFVSRMRLAGYTSRLRTRTRWALDPGAFSEIKTHGRWTVPPRQYAREARGWQDEVGMMGRAAVQDWMCEPEMLGRTGLPVPEHRARTTRSLLEVRGLEPGVRWTPVLQGWDGDDSLRHADQYARAGVDLARGPVVEVASVCPRENTESADRLMPVLHRLGIRTHGFGFKTDGLARADRHMESADRMAWSHAARFRPVRLPECEHPWPTCEYCPT